MTNVLTDAEAPTPVEAISLQEIAPSVAEAGPSTVDGTTEAQLTPLQLAASQGNAKIVEELLKKDHQLFSHGRLVPQTTPLHLAAGNKGQKYLHTVQRLLYWAAEGQDDEGPAWYVNMKDTTGKAALHHAAAAGDLDIVNNLIAAGGKLDQRDDVGLIAAHYACIEGHWVIMQVLFDRYSEIINKPMIGGKFADSTCLHIATKRNSGKAMRYLAAMMDEEGLMCKDGDDKTAWDLASGGSVFTSFSSPTAKSTRGTRTFLVDMLALTKLFHTDTSDRAARNQDLSVEDLPITPPIPRFPLNLEAASILIDMEKKIRGESMRQLWNKNDICGITCYSLPHNHFRGIYALVGELLATDSIRIADVNRFISGFRYQQYIYNSGNPNKLTLKLREPSCTVTGSTGSKFFTIAMPYFKIQTSTDIEEWRERKKIHKSLEHFTKDWKICPSNSLESLMAPYAPLTLDEYCCPALPHTLLSRRNKDQVLGRATDDGSGVTSLVTIGQLWVIQFQDGLITAYPEDQASVNPDNCQASGIPENDQVPGIPVNDQARHILVDRRASGISDNDQAREKTDNAEYFPSWAHDCVTKDVNRCIGIMLSHFVDRLDDPFGDGSGEPILNTFETSMALVVEQVDKYTRGKEENTFDIKQERDFLHQVDDIRGELTMIERVILQQEEVWKTFASNAWPKTLSPEGKPAAEDTKTPKEEEWQLVLGAQHQFDRYRRRIAQLYQDADRMEKSIMVKLDLKQKHASLRESHATAVMSAAVLGFTVITIIFTPLSFLTSLFALSIDRFQKNQVDFFIPGRENEADFTNRTRVYTTNYIGKWAATTEIVSTVVALISMWLVIEYGMNVPIMSYFWERVFGNDKKDENPDAGRQASMRIRREKRPGKSAL